MNWTSKVFLCLLVHLQASTPADSRKTRHSKGRRHSASLQYGQDLAALEDSLFISKHKVCRIRLPEKCNCTKNADSISVFCQHINIVEMPSLDFGSNLVQELHLEHNRLSSINTGIFFGTKVARLILSNNTLSHLDFLAFWGLEFHLVTLDLSYNLFMEVPEAALKLLRSLKTLVLSGNDITAIRDFSYLPKLEVLMLDDNPITAIAPETFSGTRLSQLSLDSIDLTNGLASFPSDKITLLAGLSLANNNLHDLPVDCMSSFRYLRFVNLANNSLHSLATNVFDTSKLTLATLELSLNYFKWVPQAIGNLPDLKILELNDNLISQIDADTFITLSNLEKLGLRNNYISTLDVMGFGGLDNIRTIDLRDNDLTTLEPETFYWENLKGRGILLGNNRILCNCQMKWLRKEHTRETELSKVFKDAGSIMCERPYLLEGMPLIHVSLRQFTCQHDYYYYYTVNEEDDEDFDDDIFQ